VRRQLCLQRRSDLDLAREPENHGSETAACHQDGREEFDKLKPAWPFAPLMFGIAASNTYVFLAEVLRAPSRSMAASIPMRCASGAGSRPSRSGTMLGYGVKFYGEAHRCRAE